MGKVVEWLMLRKKKQYMLNMGHKPWVDLGCRRSLLDHESSDLRRVAEFLGSPRIKQIKPLFARSEIPQR